MTVFTKEDNEDNKHIRLYQSACINILENLHLLKCIFDTKVHSYVYGSFMRWLVEFVIEFDREPTMQEVYSRISEKDIDIRIRTNEKYINFKTKTIMKIIYEKVKELGGYIEYTGYLYQDYSYCHEKEYNRFQKINLNYNIPEGNYLVWIPIEKGDFCRYDICIMGVSGISYTEDFTVNSLKYGTCYFDCDLQSVFTDIKNRNIFDINTYNFKKIYQGKKLMNNGYTIKNKEFGDNLYNSITKIKNEWCGYDFFSIYESDMKTPTCLIYEDDIIPFTKYVSTLITLEKFLNNPFIQYILEKRYCM